MLMSVAITSEVVHKCVLILMEGLIARVTMDTFLMLMDSHVKVRHFYYVAKFRLFIVRY